MTPEQAIDHAVLAFLDGADNRTAREGIELAVSSYEAALRRCRACNGTGLMKAYGQLVHLRVEHHRPEQNPVPDGDEIVCIACGGEKIDRDQTTWLCRVERYNPCSSDRRSEEHSGCGWVLTRSRPSPRQV